MADLTYRRFREEDLPGVLALWEASGWGALDAETWRSWFQTTPSGPAIITIAHDGTDVLGQMVFSPALLDTEDGAFRTVRLAAPILHPDLRKGSARSLQHPAVRLFKTGAEAAAADGYDAIYAQPERAWLPFFRWGPIAEAFQTATFGCAALSLADRAMPEGLTASLAEGVTEAHAELWTGALAAFGATAGISRDQRRLKYRVGEHLLLDVHDVDRQLVGFVAVRPNDGLVMDALAASPEDLGRVLAAAAAALAASPDVPFPALKAMCTDAWAPALDRAGFVDDDYEFVLVVNPLTERFSAVTPAAWYAVPSD